MMSRRLEIIRKLYVINCVVALFKLYFDPNFFLKRHIFLLYNQNILKYVSGSQISII